MINHLLVVQVNKVLGQGKKTSKNNYAYKCPFCHHPKPKLEIDMTENSKGRNVWNCWVCGAKGGNVIRLFKQMRLGEDKVNEVRRIVSTSNDYQEVEEDKKVSLPVGFKPFWGATKLNFDERKALNYLKNRGVGDDEIIRYNIGHCSKGAYRDTIVIPIYDSSGTLVYFIARSYQKDAWKKYSFPSTNRDIIPNEHLINWSLPIVLCEGIFDAMAIKRNAIPLLGTTIQNRVMTRLMDPRVKEIYVALDNDAIKKGLKMCERLMDEGKQVYFIKMTEGDPADLGFEEFTQLMQKTEPLTYSSLIRLKLSI